MPKLELALKIAGGLHFAILIASGLTPKALDWRKNLAMLHPFLRKLFWVYGAFIVFVIISFGTLTLWHAHELAGRTPLARGFCLFVTIFWFARLMVQFFVFDARPFLTNWFYKTGYNGLTIVFTYLAIVYALAAFL